MPGKKTAKKNGSLGGGGTVLSFSVQHEQTLRAVRQSGEREGEGEDKGGGEDALNNGLRRMEEYLQANPRHVSSISRIVKAVHLFLKLYA